MLVIASCNKKSQPDPVNSNNSSSSGGSDDYPIFYSITGFHNVTVTKGVDTTVDMPVHIDFYPSKVGVAINIDKLMDGIVAIPKSLTVYDSFDTTFVFRVKLDSVGIFKVNVSAQSTYPGKYPSSGGTSFNITVR